MRITRDCCASPWVRSASSSATSAPARSTRFAKPSPGTTSFRSISMHIFGVISLMFWSMMMVVTFKYVTGHHARRQQGRGRQPGAARADQPQHRRQMRWTSGIILLGVFATALFYGDSMITPPFRCSLRLRVSRSIIRPGAADPACGGLDPDRPVRDPAPAAPIKSAALFGPIMLLYFATIIASLA
jgi:KUP system potassium uptake protein